jgi:hypothetical protein
MVKIMLISLLLLSKIAFSQINESFSDGDFTKNPPWQGDVGLFLINVQNQLQSNGPNLASQNLSLTTASSYALNASWTFYLKLNFDPTTTNFVRIYLTSSQQDLKSALNGYFVQIGETGTTDGFHLFKQSGNTTTRIITGGQKTRVNSNVVSAKIRVTRDATGKWELFTDVNGGNNFTSEGTVVDNTFNTSAYMGVNCRYATATRFNQFIFDDFEVDDLLPDLIPPTIKSVTVFDSKSIDVNFSEAVDVNTANSISNYSLSNGYNNPINVVSINNNLYRLSFANDLTTANYNLKVDNIKDLKGNVIVPNSTYNFFYIRPYIAQKADVVINEIFANPTGSLSLPQKEFIEIWNTTNEYLLTKGWKYSDQTSTYTFGVDTIKPNQFIILCARADTTLFKPFGKTIGLSPWPSLNNDKDILTLQNENGVVLDQIAYADTWYKDDVKKKGGYTLELIDPKNICKNIQNWTATNDASGGTPGKTNSVYKSQNTTDLPKIVSAVLVDSVTLKVVFSKSVDSLSASIIANYTFNNGIGIPERVLPQSPLFNSVLLTLKKPILSGIENNLTIENLTDCAGNLIDKSANTAKFFIAKKPQENDILISEILFNPRPNSVDFVEIYNNSNQIFDLKDLQLANLDASGNVANKKVITATNVYIAPGEYWVLSTNAVNVKSNYYTEKPNQMVQMASLPAFNNDKGNVLLLSGTNTIDQLSYTEKMHVSLLQNADGVSLERISFSKPSNEIGNFTSASAIAGFATPTYKNSQQIGGEDNYVKLVSKTFSPDDDGFEDLLNLEYKFKESSVFATVNVYTDKGNLVRKLIKNQTIGIAGNITWDGLNDGGGRSNVGIYVVVFETFDLKGSTKKYKNTCVLATKLKF